MLRIPSLAIMLLMTVFLCLWSKGMFAPRLAAKTVRLLLPDELSETRSGSLKDLQVIWKESARKEGFDLSSLGASEFLRPGLSPERSVRALVVPDSMHIRAADVLTDAIDAFVSDGGSLMIVSDAFTQDLEGVYPGPERLERLTGVSYGPPLQPGVYPHYATRGKFEGKVLMSSLEGDLLAGVKQQGKGKVFFVNMPLARLAQVRWPVRPEESRLLRSMLKYFIRQVAGLTSEDRSEDPVAMNWPPGGFAMPGALLAESDFGAN